MVQNASSAVTDAVAGAVDKWQLRGEGAEGGRPKGLAVGFLGVGLVAAAAATASYMRSPGGSFVGTGGVSSVAVGLTGRPAAGATASPLSESDARSLVDKWQRIKAQALGGKHNVGALEQVRGLARPPSRDVIDGVERDHHPWRPESERSCNRSVSHRLSPAIACFSE
jgi:hypothetical protein